MPKTGPPLVLWGLVVVVLYPGSIMAAWGTGSDSVHPKDIEVLTLYSGKMTKGRRSAAVPQLECVKGGTAPCDAFRPRVVQCYNRGWDGEDVQWECKTDMDNAYRFGNIEVSCEGYNHRDDPYILKGSCGLRYSIDYTMEGHNQQQHSYYGHHHGDTYQAKTNKKLSSENYIANFIVFVGVALMLWAFYKTCIESRQVRDNAWSTTGDDYPAGGGGGGYGWFGQGGGGGTNPTAPPPPGYHSGFENDASCRNRTAGGGGGGGGTGAGGFWTGAVTGGLLGYMFGNRGNYANQRGYGFGGGGGGWSWGSGSGSGGHHYSGGGSTGTRAASGFGGTSRR